MFRVSANLDRAGWVFLADFPFDALRVRQRSTRHPLAQALNSKQLEHLHHIAPPAHGEQSSWENVDPF